jgi:hypothetical protein
MTELEKENKLLREVIISRSNDSHSVLSVPAQKLVDNMMKDELRKEIIEKQ